MRREGAPRTWMLPRPSVTRSAAIDLQLLRRRLQEDPARLLGRRDDRVADPVRPPRGEAAHAVRTGVGVRGIDEDVLDRDPERFRADLAHHALHALAQIDRGQGHGEFAAGIGVHQRLARVPAEVHADRIVHRCDPASASPGHRFNASSFPAGSTSDLAPPGDCGPATPRLAHRPVPEVEPWSPLLRRRRAAPSARTLRSPAPAPAPRRRNHATLAASVARRGHRLETLRERPVGDPGRSLDAFDERRVLRHPPVRLHVPVPVCVEDPELHGVHADQARELVHLHLEREVRPGDPEPSHRARRGAVGVDAARIDPHVRDVVGAGHVGGGLDRPVRGQPGVGARVEIDARVAGDDPAVVHHPVLDVEAFGAARARHLHLLGAAVGAAHRALGEHRAEQRQRLVDAVHLAAEASAHGAADEVEPVRGQVQDPGRGLQAEEERLGVRVADVTAGGVGGRDAPAGLGRRVLDRRHLVALLDDVVGLAEAAFDVAEADLPEVVAVVVVPVPAVVLVDQRGVRRQRLLDVEHRGQGLVVDPDLRGGGGGGRFALRDHRRDRLAAIADLVERQRRLVVGPRSSRMSRVWTFFGTSSEVRMCTTPGICAASRTSIERIRAWWWGLRANFMCSIPARRSRRRSGSFR